MPKPIEIRFTMALKTVPAEIPNILNIRLYTIVTEKIVENINMLIVINFWPKKHKIMPIPHMIKQITIPTNFNCSIKSQRSERKVIGQTALELIVKEFVILLTSRPSVFSRVKVLFC